MCRGVQSLLGCLPLHQSRSAEAAGLRACRLASTYEVRVPTLVQPDRSFGGGGPSGSGRPPRLHLRRPPRHRGRLHRLLGGRHQPRRQSPRHSCPRARQVSRAPDAAMCGDWFYPSVQLDRSFARTGETLDFEAQWITGGSRARSRWQVKRQMQLPGQVLWHQGHDGWATWSSTSHCQWCGRRGAGAQSRIPSSFSVLLCEYAPNCHYCCITISCLDAAGPPPPFLPSTCACSKL